MAIQKIVHKFERIVPVRFARAPDANDPTVAGSATDVFDGAAPEPDDRGFAPLPSGTAVFPVGLEEAVALNSRVETRVRLIREDMENAGTIFVTSANPAVLVVTLPAPPTALPSTREMMIKMRPVTAGSTHLEIRFGRIDGPIIHRLQVDVHPLVEIRTIAHVPTINGAVVLDGGVAVPAVSTRTDAQIRALFDTVNAIYFPYGIRFLLDAVIDRGGAPLALTSQGVVRINEFARVTAFNRNARAVNTYMVPRLALDNGTLGITGLGSSATRDRVSFGLLVADTGLGQTAGHELGHLLNIVNFANGRLGHADENSAGTTNRSDVVTRRRLMISFLNLGNDPNRPYRDDVGYGTIAGGMLTIKQLDHDPTDLELTEVRRTAARLVVQQAGP